MIDALLSHSPHGILISDANGKLTLHNKAAERIWAGSATADNVAGWAKYRAFHADGRPYQATDWAMAHVLTHKEAVQPKEIHIQRFDDTHGVLVGGDAPICPWNPDCCCTTLRTTLQRSKSVVVRGILTACC